MIKHITFVGAIPRGDFKYPVSIEKLHDSVRVNDPDLWECIQFALRNLGIQFSADMQHDVFNIAPEHGRRDWLKIGGPTDIVMTCLVGNAGIGRVAEDTASDNTRAFSLLNVSEKANESGVWYKKAQQNKAKIILTRGRSEYEVETHDFCGQDYLEIIPSSDEMHDRASLFCDPKTLAEQVEYGLIDVSDYWVREIGMLIDRDYALEIMPDLNPKHFLYRRIANCLLGVKYNFGADKTDVPCVSEVTVSL